MNKTLTWTLFCTSALFAINSYALQIDQVTASGADTENGHTAERIADHDTKTRWAIPKSGWVEISLQKATQINNLYMLPFKADARQLKFQINYSLDGKQWTALSQQISTDGQSKQGELFTFHPVQAKYIKLNVYGTNVNKWSAINEVELNSTKSVKQVAIN